MDLDQYIKFIGALLFVVVLIVVVAWLMRRIGLGGVATGAMRHRRLSLVEVMPLDAKRRLVLVRQDSREHLILLSATGDLVVGSGPADGFQAALAAAAPPSPGPAQPVPSPATMAAPMPAAATAPSAPVPAQDAPAQATTAPGDVPVTPPEGRTP
jgi:flagellar protein FliO/FliZ